MRVQRLSPGKEEVWFAIRKATDAAAWTALSHSLASGPFAPDLLLVIYADQTAVGRLMIRVKDSQIKIFNPVFVHLDDGFRLVAMQRLLEEALREIRACESIRGLEILAQPAHDIPNYMQWIKVLQRYGFGVQSQYRLYRKEFTDRVVVTCGEAHDACVLTGNAGSNLNELAEVFAIANAGTLDRRKRHFATTAEYLKSLQAIGYGYDPSLWLLAHSGDRCIAFVLACLSNKPEFEGASAWILELGTVPSMRGRGIGTWMLSELMVHALQSGARRLLATIDVQNEASIRVHLKSGFNEEPGDYFELTLLLESQ